MTVRICLANSTLTGGTWKRSEATAFNFTLGAANCDDINTARNIPITFSNAGNQQGIVLMFKVGSLSSPGTLTVKLQNVAGDTTYTTDNFTIASTFTALVLGANTQIMYLPLSIYAVLAGAGLYRYQISGSVASKLYLWRTAVAGDYFYACILDANTDAPTTGDSLIVANGYSLTNNATFTYGSTNGRALIICENASWAWSSPAAPYTATFQGYMVLSNNAQVDAGSSGSPISVANKATIDVSALTTYWIESGTYNSWGYQNNILNFYGFEDLSLSTRADGEADALQPVIITKDDMSAVWQIGDSIKLFGKGRTGGSAYDTVTYTIQNIVGKTLTLNANLDYFLYDKAGILNTTRATTQVGIVINGASGLLFCTSAGWYVRRLNFHGCYFNNIAISTFNTWIAGETLSVYRCYLYEPTVTTYGLWFNCYIGYPVTVNMLDVFVDQSSGNGRNIEVDACINSTFANVFVKNAVWGFVMSGNNNTISKLAAHSCQSSADYSPINISGTAHEVSDSLFDHGGSALYSATAGLYYTTFSDCIIDNGATYSVRFYGNAINIFFNDCKIGDTISAGTDEITVSSYMIATILCRNCNPGSAGLLSISNLIDNSYIRFHEYDSTPNDHRCFEKYGDLMSTGDGLGDTTVHTAGSGKFAIRFEPKSSASNLEWVFKCPTGNIQTKTMQVSVWVKINHANYYAGTHQNPKLTIDYDDGTEVSDTAADITDWQLLTCVFTPTTTYGELTITISGRTDAINSQAYFYVDDFSVLLPAGYALNLGGLDLWADALPITPPLATVIVALDVWQVAISILTGAGTIGKYVMDMIDAAISSRAPSVTALSTAQWTNVRAELLDYLDAMISSRLASAGYTTPPTAGQVADAVFDESETGHSGWITKLLKKIDFLALK